LFDVQAALDAAVKLLPKLPCTLFMTALALAGGLALGLILAVVRIRRVPVLAQAVVAYVSFMRCTPTLVQLFLIFYCLPLLVKPAGIDIEHWSSFTYAVIALGLHSAAVLSEVLRAAYLSVPETQFEAASSIGMTYAQTLRRIVIPQALRIALPNLGNNAISLFKETSLAFSIGVVDLMGQAQIIINRNYGIAIVEVYAVVSLIYWACSWLLGRFIDHLNLRWAAKYSLLAGKASHT